MALTQAQRRRYIRACASQQAKSVKRGSVCDAQEGADIWAYAASLSSLFKLKIYSIVITLLFGALLGFQAIVFFIEKGDQPINIATFSDSKGQPGQFKLVYNKNGDLTFTTDKFQSPIPSITRWDYYGATEVKAYNWMTENTIVIETMDSTIKIVVPEFTIFPK